MILNKNQIQEVVETIVKGYKPENVFLFGSYQQGTPNENSDLDLAIIKKTNKRKFERAADVKRLFNPYPCAMDIVVFTPEEFEKSRRVLNTLAYFIDKEHKMLYGKQLS